MYGCDFPSGSSAARRISAADLPGLDAVVTGYEGLPGFGVVRFHHFDAHVILVMHAQNARFHGTLGPIIPPR